MDKLDDYEKDILESYENDEWVSVKNVKEKRVCSIRKKYFFKK